MTIAKTYIDANQLLLDSYELGLRVLESGFRPDFIVGVWRGGAPVGIAIQELLQFLGVATDHIAIRTSHYTGIEQTRDSVQVHGLQYLVDNVNAASSVLIVDDVFDTGRSVQQVIWELAKQCGSEAPTVKIATPYFKPANNRTELQPDFFVHQSDQWLVFPHELDGLSDEEVARDKPGLGHLRQRILRHHRQT